MKLSGIKKIYHNKKEDRVALKGIDLTLEEKGFVVILGPSGCGKTTLLSILAGVDKDFEGEIVDWVKGEYIAQEYLLFEDMTVLDNLLIVEEDKEVIMSLLRYFELEDFLRKKVRYLSNGQKRRVQMIRSLLLKPEVLLCDEPSSALDPVMTEKAMKLLKSYSKNTMVIVVTHDIAMAEKYADRIITMKEAEIVRDEVRNGNEVFEGVEKKKERRSLQEHFSFLKREICSRWLSFLLNVFYVVAVVLLMFGMLTLYQGVELTKKRKECL